MTHKPVHYQQDPTPKKLLPIRRDFERGPWALRLITNDTGTLELWLFDSVERRSKRAIPDQRKWFGEDGALPTQKEIDQAIKELIIEREEFHEWDKARDERYEASIEALKGYDL